MARPNGRLTTVPRRAPSAGAVRIGARMPLIAYNINSPPTGLMCKENRGGYPPQTRLQVRQAMGIPSKTGIVQVSMT